MNKYPDKIESLHEEQLGSTIDHEFPPRNISDSSVTSTKLHPNGIANELLRICQALLLSTSVLLLSYHSMRYGKTEYSILESAEIVRGYTQKAVVTLSLGYSIPYSMVSFLATGMLAYSLVSKSPRWSLPSLILYLADLVCDVSDAIVAIWLYFFNFPFTTALSYAMGTTILILCEIWIWLGVLRLYEHRAFRSKAFDEN